MYKKTIPKNENVIDKKEDMRFKNTDQETFELVKYYTSHCYEVGGFISHCTHQLKLALQGISSQFKVTL